MKAVWHAVPRDMVGDVLYPLTQLRAVDPAAYEMQRQKYRGRPAVLEYRVPLVDLHFNAMVHCSPVHPYRMYTARRAAGLPVTARPAPPAPFTGLFFEIPLERITVHPVLWYAWRVLWANGAPDEDALPEPPAEEFEPFDPDRYSPLNDVPDAHRQYLAACKDAGKPALAFVHIPHVLVAGAIDVRDCRVVCWSEAAAQA